MKIACFSSHCLTVRYSIDLLVDSKDVKIPVFGKRTEV